MGKKRNIAQIVELFMLFAILLMVITVITVTFVTTRNKSTYARDLTEAVCAAEQVTEISMSSYDEDELSELLERADSIDIVTVANSAGRQEYILEVGMSEEGGGRLYTVVLTREEEKGTGGKYIDSHTDVSLKGSDSVLYSLDSGKYIEEGR